MKKICVSEGMKNTLARIENSLLLGSPELSNETLHNLMYSKGINQDRLFVPVQSGFDAKAPNQYIQKIRAIYYLMLVCVFGQPNNLENLHASIISQSDEAVFSSKILINKYGTLQSIESIKNSFYMLKLQLYTDKSIPKTTKKYFAQFLSILEKTSKNKKNRISNTINIYPIIDEILIDTLLKIVGSQSVDDNLNIERSLQQKFGLKCKFDMFREFKIEGISIKIIKDGFRIEENQEFTKLLAEQIEEILHKNRQEFSNQINLMDVSRVGKFSESIFIKMEESYIKELDLLCNGQDQTVQTDSEKKQGSKIFTQCPLQQKSRSLTSNIISQNWDKKILSKVQRTLSRNGPNTVQLDHDQKLQIKNTPKKEACYLQMETTNNPNQNKINFEAKRENPKNQTLIKYQAYQPPNITKMQAQKNQIMNKIEEIKNKQINSNQTKDFRNLSDRFKPHTLRTVTNIKQNNCLNKNPQNEPIQHQISYKNIQGNRKISYAYDADQKRYRLLSPTCTLKQTPAQSMTPNIIHIKHQSSNCYRQPLISGYMTPRIQRIGY